jgi:hypothetical protein
MVMLWHANGEDMAPGTYELNSNKTYKGALQVGVGNSFHASEGH